jgi:site-specific DNA recombinase
MEKGKMFYSGNREEHERRLAGMRKEKADLEKKVSSLIDTLAELDDNSAKKSIIARINEMNTEIDKISQGIDEMISLTAEHAFSDIEFDVLRQMLGVFKNTIDDMSYEQKRAAIGSIVRRVIWDGENAHVILFGSQNGDIELPDITPYIKHIEIDTDDDEELIEFSDVDYDEDTTEDFGRDTKTDLCEDSKRNSNAFQKP